PFSDIGSVRNSVIACNAISLVINSLRSCRKCPDEYRCVNDETKNPQFRREKHKHGKLDDLDAKPNSDLMFKLLVQDKESNARRGRLTTAHGEIDTPAFMPVGTQGSVKGISPRELHELNAQIVLGNTYHLFVRPGLDVLKHFGGLHNFMNWNGPI